MAPALHLRAALKRGALVAIANWPLVVVQFVAEAVYKLALAVPIVGGVFMVSVLVGEDAGSMLSGGVRAAAGVVFESLSGAPVALASFLAALGLVAAGAAVVTWLARAGAVPLLVAGERSAPELGGASGAGVAFRRAAACDLGGFLARLRQFARRYLWLGAGLVLSYVVIGAAFAVVIVATYRMSDQGGWSAAWPLVALVATSGAVVAIAFVNLLADLLQIVIACGNCGLREAARSLKAFLMHDARQVAGVFGVVLALVVLATAASLLVTAGLWLIAFVPLVGVLVFLPLQAAAWLVRGLVFEYVGVTALAAYISQYRRFAEGDADSPGSSPAWAQ
jgi:hypothetical protein